MKKGISLVLALALVLSLFTFLPSALAADKVVFEFYHGVGGDMAKVLDEIVANFNASQDKYECKPIYYPSYDDAFKAYQAALAAKQPPAMILGGVDLSQAKKGIFADCLPLIAEDPTFPLKDYVDVYIQQGMYDGKLYMLPFYGTAWMVFYDKNKFAESGIDPKVAFSSWEKLGEAAKQLTKIENGEVTYWGFEPMYGVNNMYDAALSLGGKVLSEDGTKILVNDEKWVKAWDMFRKWIYDDKIMTIHYGGEGWEYWYKTMDDVLEGRAAGFIGSAGDLQTLDWNKVDAALFPGWEGVGPATPELSCLKIAINGTSDIEQQRGALQFYKFFTSPENGGLWSMKTGYIPAIKTAIDSPEYQEFLKTAPYMKVAFDSVLHGLPPYDDPTNGKIWEELSIACDKVMIENIPAQEALDEAAANIQAEIDLALSKK
jgi:multiple sugar transport system substrate-binding protein